MPRPSIICPVCEIRGEYTTGKEIYPHRQDLWHLKLVRCPQCGAHASCDDEGVPKSSMAGPELRKLRVQAHRAFDKLWKGAKGKMSRGDAYGWLSTALEYPLGECHIAFFDEDLCKQVIAEVAKLNEIGAYEEAQKRGREARRRNSRGVWNGLGQRGGRYERYDQ